MVGLPYVPNVQNHKVLIKQMYTFQLLAFYDLFATEVASSLRLVEELVTKTFTCVSVLLPSWQVVNDPLHSRLSIQVLSLEPCNTNPY